MRGLRNFLPLKGSALVLCQGEYLYQQLARVVIGLGRGSRILLAVEVVPISS